ncbi:hypothetical protein BGZ94_007727 [Podila epigama]|nr:hypothetical protein BGZ94_007727 [Podila epigama]
MLSKTFILLALVAVLAIVQASASLVTRDEYTILKATSPAGEARYTSASTVDAKRPFIAEPQAEQEQGQSKWGCGWGGGGWNWPWWGHRHGCWW